MKKVNYIKNVMLTAILLLSVAFTANAQQNPKYLCDTNSNNTVDLSLDVMGNGFHPRGGQWYALPKGTYAQSGTTVTNTDAHIIAANKASNIFVATGKAPGKYDFVFVASNSNACIPVGERRLATVIILEAPKPVSHSLSLCAAEEKTLDLKTLISSTLPTPATFTNVDPATAGTLTTNQLKINKDFEGKITLNYAVTHTGAPADFCNKSTITIDVKRDGSKPVVQGGDITYCITEMPSTLNLNTKLSTAVAGGTWAVAKEAGTGGTPTIAAEVATFVTPKANDVYKFTYSWPEATGGCYVAGSVSFKVNVTDAISVPANPVVLDICKADNSNAVIDMLRDGVGMAIPLSTGTWKPLTPDNNPKDIDVTDGMFEVADAVAGTYNYKFDISNANNLCGLENKSIQLTINVTDTAVQDARMEFCVTAIPANINLADYVDNLPAGANWTTNLTGFANVTTTPSATGTITGAELTAADVGTHKFDYSYNSGTCGTAKGSLYLTVTEKLDVKEAITLNYCRPDLPTGGINLTNAIGMDVPGTWAITANPGSTGVLTGNKFTETITSGADKVYTVTFTPTNVTTDGKDHCGAKVITVTINVSDNKF